MVVDLFRIIDSAGVVYSSNNPPLVKYGSYGQTLSIVADMTTSAPISGNLYFDAALFLDDEMAHPRNGSPSLAFVVNVDGMADLDVRDMNIIGNDATNIIGTAKLGRVDSTHYEISHTFTLGEDISNWMDKGEYNVQDNSDAYSSKGAPLNVYDTIKKYGVYVYTNTESVTDYLNVSFNEFGKTNYGTPHFEIHDYRIFRGGVESDVFSDGVDNELRIYFTDTNLDFESLEVTLLANPLSYENLPREVAYEVKSYTGLTTATDVFGLYTKVTVPYGDIQAGRDYTPIAILKGTTSKSSSKSYIDSSSGDRDYTPCEPFFDVKWKSYLNTKESSKINVAPLERMALEIHMWHNETPTSGGVGYLNCINSQGFLAPIFTNVFGNCHIDFYDGTRYNFTRIFSGYEADKPNSEYERTTINGHDVSIFRIFFRVDEPYLGQVHPMNFVLETALKDGYTFENNFYQVITVRQTFELPLLMYVRLWENDTGLPAITSMKLTDSNGASIPNGICDTSEYIQVTSESPTNFKAQALYQIGAGTQEEENFASVQSEPFFNQRANSNIYDLEDDFSTDGNNKFKINKDLGINKIIIIGCQ